ncbi:MAG: energy transducer TonB [Gemmatimonadetes bacterium]|nr:energy transducer TonB [Gemmatimonadota bacterium]
MTENLRRGLRLAAAALLVACGADPPPVPPKALDGPSPFAYPLALWDEGAQGETTLLVRVDESGAVDSVRVLRSSGRSAFDSAAAAGAWKLRFLPAHRAGRKLSMWVKLPVRFTRDRTAADTAGLGGARP